MHKHAVKYPPHPPKKDFGVSELLLQGIVNNSGKSHLQPPPINRNAGNNTILIMSTKMAAPTYGGVKGHCSEAFPLAHNEELFTN